MTYAITDDVAKQLGRPAASDAETDQWQAWLDVVERAIARGFRRNGFDLAEQVGLGAPTSQDVADVEVAAVIRKVQNPKWGESSYTKSLDDGSVTTRREGAGADNDPLALLDTDWTTLLPAATKRARAFSVMPS